MTLQPLKTDYAGRRRTLFWLALKTSILTLLTLGIYRFWMKTRLRRFYWSAIRPGGIPLEYTGTGVEKLMGFLVAVVFMAFYIGIVNLLLVFLSFSFLNDNIAAYAMSFIGIIPIYFFASYRARHYVLARTRWRGLRFGIEPAAWGYAWRAMLHWLATILTLGFLLPRQMFWLEKYRVERTWYGFEKFEQTGNWKMLLPVAKYMYAGLVVSIVAVVAAVAGQFAAGWYVLLAAGLPLLLFGFIHFRVQAFRILVRQKRLGTGIRFSSMLRTWRVVRIYLLGSVLAGLVLFAGVMALAIAAWVILLQLDPAAFAALTAGQVSGPSNPLWHQVVIGIGIGVYFVFFIFWGVLTQVFITLPLMRHYAETLSIANSHHLALIRQRPRDTSTGAEGFAEALDIGAAI